MGGALDSAVGYVHVVASRMDRYWDLVSGCFCQDPDLNRRTAATYGVPQDRLYDDWKAYVAAESALLDAVLVLTPTPMHRDVVEFCLVRGLPVICEKALAVNAEDVRHLIQVRDEHRGFLAVTYNYSGYPMVREMRAMIAKAKIGKVLHFHAEMPQEGFIRLAADGKRPSPQAWRLHDGPVPTLHLDLAVHLHQLIHYLTGATPMEVVSDQRHYGWFDGIIDNVTALCRYSDGIQGQMWFSKSSLGHRNGLRLRVYGSDGALEWYQASPEEVMYAGVEGQRQILDRGAPTFVAGEARYTRFKAGHPAGFIEAFANLYTDIAHALRQHRSGAKAGSLEVFGPELALEGLLFCEAMVQSAKRGEWVTVEKP